MNHFQPGPLLRRRRYYKLRIWFLFLPRQKKRNTQPRVQQTVGGYGVMREDDREGGMRKKMPRKSVPLGRSTVHGTKIIAACAVNVAQVPGGRARPLDALEPSYVGPGTPGFPPGGGNVRIDKDRMAGLGLDLRAGILCRRLQETGISWETTPRFKRDGKQSSRRTKPRDALQTLQPR